MGLAVLKKELRRFSKDELINIVTELYKRNDAVKEFLDFQVTHDEEALLKRYRLIVHRAFFTKWGVYNIKDAKRAISAFKKLETSPKLLSSLMLFYVETGLRFADEIGDMEGVLYSSLDSTYCQALRLMTKANMRDTFYEQVREVDDSTRCFDWKVEDFLDDGYYDFLDNEE